MAIYRYVCHDLRTNAYLGEVPAGSVQYNEAENAVSSLTFTVDLAERSTVNDRMIGGQYRDMLRSGRVKVTPLRYGVDAAGRPVGSGNPILGSHIVWTVRYDGRALHVNCGGMWSYFTADGGAEPLWQNRSFSNVDQHEIGRQLIAFAQQGNGDIGLQVAGNNSGVLRTETYEGAELARIGTRIEEMANRQNGYEFSVTTAIVNDAPVSTWRPWYPRRGRRVADSGLTFELGQNLRAYTLTSEPPTTTYRTVGAGEGTAMLRAVANDASLISQGYPALVRVSAGEYKDVSVQATLQAHANGDLRRFNDERDVWTLELVDPDDRSTPFGAWQVGDDAKIVIPAGMDYLYPEGTEVTKRIIGQSVSIPDNGGPESITLRMGAARG